VLEPISHVCGRTSELPERGANGRHLRAALTSPLPPESAFLPNGDFVKFLRKGAAVVLQPDLCHAGGITEVRLIAGMAEAYYAAIAPH